jgi:small subunit ribosomal protein S6
MAEAQHQYEAMFLFGPAAATDLDGALATARQMIERHGGEILVLKKWDERKLAYEISGQKRGTYVIAYFNGPGGAVGAIERDVRLSEEVLRVLVLRVDHLSRQEMEAVEPQPIERPPERREEGRFDRGDRYERGDRPDRGDRPERGPRPEAGEERKPEHAGLPE